MVVMEDRRRQLVSCLSGVSCKSRCDLSYAAFVHADYLDLEIATANK
jgi:hypothetical protein